MKLRIPRKTIMILSAGVGAMALASALFFHHGMRSNRASNKIVSKMGEKHRGFKDYDPEVADQWLRSVIESAKVCATSTGLLTDQGLALNEKLWKHDPARDVWTVVFWHESDFDDDVHSTAIFVEVSKDLSCEYTGIIVH